MPEFMEPEETPGGEPVEAPAGEPSASAEVPAVPVVEEPTSDAPWAAELRERFADPETFKAVDQYMRESVQPYVTELETKSKPNRDATRLWEAFHEDPTTTYEQITRELYETEPERAEAILAAMRGETPELDYEDDFPGEIPTDNLTPEQRAFIEEGIQAREQSQYDALLADVEATLTNPEAPEGPVPFDKDIFQHQLVMADGDAEEAMVRYRAYVDKAKQAFGLNLPAPGSLGVTPAPQAPPTINSTTQTNAVTPPQEPNYDGDVSKAIDDMFTTEPPPSVPS